MATVTQLLDRASRLTGLRTDGSERELALMALEDAYINTILESEIVEYQYTHKFLAAANNENDLTLETYNDQQFQPVTNESVTFGAAPDTQQLSESSINPSGVKVTDDPATTVYVEGTDYSVDPSTGQITSITLPAGNYLVSYFRPPTVLFSGDIAIPPNVRIISVVYNDSTSSSYPLHRVSEAELLDHRRGYEAVAYTRLYAMAGTNIMRLWPKPATNETITITYVPLPPALSETDNRPAALWDKAVWDLSQWDDFRGVESTPSLVPVQFHFNTLLPGTVVQMLDKDQRTGDVQFWQGRFEAGLAKMQEWHAMYGGQPTPVFDGTRQHFFAWPDQYNRSSWG